MSSRDGALGAAQNARTTTMKTLRFGIEIETVGLGRTKLAEAIHSVVGGIISTDYRDMRITTASGRTWKVVPDCSLSGGENSGEIVSPVLGYDDIEELQSIIRAVRTAGASHSVGPRRSARVSAVAGVGPSTGK